MQSGEHEQIELDLLLEAIYRRYGYDFRHYAQASLKRRIHSHIKYHDLDSIADLIPRVLQNEQHFQALLFDITVVVTEMFRDPWFFARLKELVFPYLSTFPYFNVWLAGCATGEEVYSLAILIQEAGLMQRCRIYATDINNAAIEKARSRILPLKRMKEYSQNYIQAGGSGSLSDYYLARYDAAIFHAALLDKITFAAHNLATDGAFGEMHLVLCRNVLIYFDRQLQNRALTTFRDSLRRGGFLCLGSRESLDFSAIKQDFVQRAQIERIYQFRSSAESLACAPDGKNHEE